MSITIDPASGGYRVHVWGGNNKLVFWTEVYSQKAGAWNAVRLLQSEAASAPVYDRT
jgi:uncharacterized protein YegP (UPF0339 family)